MFVAPSYIQRAATHTTLSVSTQVEDPPFSSNSEPRARRKDSIGDAAALALAVCLPGLRSLTLRECPRLSSAGWLALASLSSLTYLDVRRWCVFSDEQCWCLYLDVQRWSLPARSRFRCAARAGGRAPCELA
eukprot:1161897-Pelagomonas_calceolata.AAC.15